MRASVADWLPLRRDMLDDPAIQKDPDMLAFLKMAQNARGLSAADAGLVRYRHASTSSNAVQKAILNPDQIEPIFRALDATLTRKLKEG